MTLAEIAALDKEMLTCADIAEILGTNPQDIRVQIRQDPMWLGFPVTRIGSRTKIPRRPFLQFMGYEE